MYGQKVTMRKRILSTVWAVALNAVFWIVVPYYLGTLLVGKVPDSAITIPTFVYEFGIMFIILDGGAAFFQGMAISVPFISGAALLTVVYLWLVTNGGNLSIRTSGIDIGLGFQLLLYVVVLPSFWAAIRAPLSYLVWKRNAPIQPAVTPAPA
jgi:hypothetical protein